MAEVKKKRVQKKKNKGGRPSREVVKIFNLIKNLALLGLSDAEICKSIEVPKSTFSRWKKNSQRFRNILFEAREGAQAKVTRRLYERAMGFEHKAVKIFCSEKGGVTQVPYTEIYPPDPVAAKFILTNRSPLLWRDKVVVEQTKGGLAERLKTARERARGGKEGAGGAGKEG